MTFDLHNSASSFLEDDTSGGILNRTYDYNFESDDEYRATLPDLQNGSALSTVGSHVRIEHVGISNFRVPLQFMRRCGDKITLETSITGTVSLEANKKGINMSRIMRSFYNYTEDTFSYSVMGAAIDAYKSDLESFDARLMARFSFPAQVRSLRSGLVGWQYYDIAMEIVDRGGKRKSLLHLDYIYSSTCPCSLELSEHARRERRQLATPHSQRSIARISVEIKDTDTNYLCFEDLIDMARSAVPTETQVMVKREDEQAFAELNAAHPMFVEDAVRAFADRVMVDPRIGDFRIVASHQESLHSHDAVAVLSEGPTFDSESFDPTMFQAMLRI